MKEYSETKIETEEKKPERKKMLIELMSDKQYRPMKFKELAMLLEVPKEDRDQLRDLLEELVEEGKIGVSAHGKYAKPELFSLIGTFQSTARGFGFVTIEGREDDVFIPADAVKDAMHGDTVEIALVKGRRGDGRREEGRIVRVKKHAVDIVVGTFQKSKNYGFVVPDNQKIARDIFIEEADCKSAQGGQKVVCSIKNYGDERKNPSGVITEILGFATDPGTDILAIARAYQLSMEFPEEEIAFLERIPEEVLEEEKIGRLDLRNLPTVTIDGEDAKDLDDAITLTKEGDLYHLGVHIADVTHYVTEGSPLDEEAEKRGTSVYLVDRVIPMLPRKLSNGICSLNQGCDRLALSCLMDIDQRGMVVGHKITETLIRVDRRMDYTTVNDLLTNPNSSRKEEYTEFLELFSQMETLSALLRRKRASRGAIDFDFPESKIVLNEMGLPVDIHPYERNVATKLIEDFMLIANETVAEEFFWMELPFLYRIHEKPDEEKMRSFAMFINNFGYSLHVKDGEIHPKKLQQLLDFISGTDAEPLISRLMLRSMKQAKYSTENLGHFGLSAKYYCHFTSPIRRYPDLQIHRIIKENLHGQLSEKELEHLKKILPEVAKHSSETERRAEEAERETVKLKKVQYMQDHIGEAFDGVISGVTAYGFYVELSNTIEGMVHVSTLVDDYYEFIEKSYSLVGEMTGKTYSLGKKVSVRAVNADPMLKVIDFEVIKEKTNKKKKNRKGEAVWEKAAEEN